MIKLESNNEKDIVEMKNNRSSMYRKRTAHYNHVRRIRRPSKFRSLRLKFKLLSTPPL